MPPLRCRHRQDRRICGSELPSRSTTSRSTRRYLRVVSFRRITIVLLATVASAGVSVAAATGSPSGTSTHPHVSPTVGGHRTAFTVSFELRQAPGHQGVLMTGYRLAITPPRQARASCQPAQPALILTGRKGTVLKRVLRPGPHGWCTGRYRVTVFLQRGPYCPRVTGQPPTPCPQFATQELDVGDAHFTVS